MRLLGPVTREAVLAGLYDGLRLGTIVICVGAANALANPKRLLRSVPAALHEVGTALVVAVTVLPQLADSARRVRAAQALRAGRHPAYADGSAATWCRSSRTRSSGRCGWPRGWTPAATAARAASTPCRAAAHRRADAGRPVRRLRRRLRRPRPHRAAGAGDAHAACSAWPPPSAGWSCAGRRVDRTPLPPRPVALAGVRGDAVRRRHRGRRLVGGGAPARGGLPGPHDVPGGDAGRAGRRAARVCSPAVAAPEPRMVRA